MTSASRLKPYQAELIEQTMSAGALKFGSFTLKSGRVSPYFFNTGLLSSGSLLASLASAYAQTIASTPEFSDFEVLFGPAYKGIPFAACTALTLSTMHGRDVGFAYDRKEAKDHGEGGVLVGVPIQGKRVLILDDVMTAGTAISHAIALIKAAGGEVVGVVQCLDREEVGKDGVSSTVKEIENVVGEGRVKAILKARDLVAWLEGSGNGTENDLLKMREYQREFGVKQ
jgi:orotate phosphoribosyltransferase